MERRSAVCIAIAWAAALWCAPAFPHCEVPCGIYNDAMRIEMIEEDVATVEKSMQQIVELSKAEEKNFNQIVRWVTNKDFHAGKIQETVAQYFMTQRIAPADPKDAKAYGEYVKKLTLLHEMLVEAMKAKQTTDLDHVKKLRSLLASFSAAYMGEPSREPAAGAGAEHGRAQ